MTINDKVILDEADRLREHDLQMKKIEASMLDSRLRHERNLKDARRTFIGFVLAGLFVLAIVVSIAASNIGSNRDANRFQERQQIRNAEIAKECIKAGNIWMNDDCLLAQKDG